MNPFDDTFENRGYTPFALPARKPEPATEPAGTPRRANSTSGVVPPEAQTFAEIEIPPAPGVFAAAETVPKPSPVRIPTGEAYTLFAWMRQIAWEAPLRGIDHTKLFYNRDHRRELAKIFYKQAVFMQDFEDNSTEQVPFSTYYPYYQLMNDAQLRTYFTWRTRARKGDIAPTSLSYAFLYVYELISNIGIRDPRDGLARLVQFWRVFKAQDNDGTLDKYILKWMKDYHIYYPLPLPFTSFIRENGLQDRYPQVSAPETDNADSFALYKDISKYDIRLSAFYNEETSLLIRDCFNFVICRIKQKLADAEISFDDLLYPPSTKKLAWHPFDGALFYPWLAQPGRCVTLSEKEIYICRQNNWTRHTLADGNKQWLGYVMKQTESVLRICLRFKHKLSASLTLIDAATARRLAEKGLQPDILIRDAVMDFWTERNKTVVSVDVQALEKIRQEALTIQEKLVVQDSPIPWDDVPFTPAAPAMSECTPETLLSTLDNATREVTPPARPAAETPTVEAPSVSDQSDPWTSFRQSLTPVEIKALAAILREEDIHPLAAAQGLMIEVLLDSLNQKAYDAINDNIFEYDGTVMMYPEYAPLLSACFETMSDGNGDGND